MMQSCHDVLHKMRGLVGFGVALPVLSALSAAPVEAQGYSYEEQEACTGDAFRLCSEFIPNISRITACMQAKRDQLSPRCARMFEPGRERHLNEPNTTPYGEQRRMPPDERHEDDME